MNKLEIPHINDYTPLWHNKTLPHLLQIPDPGIWESGGILYIHHLFSHGILKQFDVLCTEFTLPNYMFFRFFQIRHAMQSQFPQAPPQPAFNNLVAVVKGTDPQKLISTFYNMLITPPSTKIAYRLKTRWEREVGQMEDEEWTEALDTCKVVSPKLSDRLSQIFILHHAYFTPIRVARYKRDSPPTCCLCLTEPGTFFHLIWACPLILGFWKQVVDFLHDTMGSP